MIRTILLQTLNFDHLSLFQCIYAIRLKPDAEVNSKVQRSAPRSIAVQPISDVHNLRLLVFYPLTKMEVAVHVTASNAEHYRY